jgi:acetyltransferase-like isoleucine patch superfamily enzyme
MTIKFHGNNNYIEIHEPYKFDNVFIETIDNLNVIIGPFANIYNLEIHKMWGSIRPFPSTKITIGEKLSCNGAKFFVSPDEGNITIGDDCMFSFGIVLSISDAHVIIDKKKGNILNGNKDIIIGNHVWVGMNCTILKGAHVASNSVIGSNAVVTKQFHKENIILGGNPAKIIKRNISWDRPSIPEFMARKILNEKCQLGLYPSFSGWGEMEPGDVWTIGSSTFLYFYLTDERILGIMVSRIALQEIEGK